MKNWPVVTKATRKDEMKLEIGIRRMEKLEYVQEETGLIEEWNGEGFLLDCGNSTYKGPEAGTCGLC